ncbi:MAG: metallophosphatase [Bacteroidota bacterium]|jgi:hypothetical protein|nr:metallophosphatase [Bacteroidota bacterium]
MTVVLHPRAAPADRLRVWVGVFDVGTAPPLQWFLDSVPTSPTALRSLASARTDAMLPRGANPASVPRSFTGVYEFTGLDANRSYTVAVHAGAVGATATLRTLPIEVPRVFDGAFTVLLVSCFHRDEDPAGLAGTIVSRLPAARRPDLSLLMGDQVYLDLPTLRDFRDDETWLAEKFERDYIMNWSGTPGYAQILDAAPSVSLPDDHEYWNNYPHPSPMIGNSLSAGGRGRWARAAIAMEEAFQRPYPASVEHPLVLNIPPLSFFFPDTRTGRDPARGFTMHPDALTRMHAWVDGVIARRDFPVFVSGQSLYSPPVGSFSGAVKDYELPNYRDYGAVLGELGRLTDAGVPALLLTGDVHWGRVTETRDTRSNRTSMYEIISSPASLVTTVGADQVSAVGAWLGGLFGRPKSWPRHSDPETPPDLLAREVFGPRFHNTIHHGQRGNHVALLRFARRGDGLEFTVTYWPITRDAALAAPVDLGPFTLRWE